MTEASETRCTTARNRIPLFSAAADGALDIEHVGEALDGEADAVEVLHVLDLQAYFEGRRPVAVGLRPDSGDIGLHLREDRANVRKQARAIQGLDDEHLALIL